jgi:hypothetical protein
VELEQQVKAMQVAMVALSQETLHQAVVAVLVPQDKLVRLVLEVLEVLV